ncbi:hypothetical protein KEM54_002374 [Ascosphaera aggregata]|nr:hypothetical protein KEM54_002374 [Ascosphaera aggregata]
MNHLDHLDNHHLQQDGHDVDDDGDDGGYDGVDEAVDLRYNREKEVIMSEPDEGSTPALSTTAETAEIAPLQRSDSITTLVESYDGQTHENGLPGDDHYEHNIATTHSAQPQQQQQQQEREEKEEEREEQQQRQQPQPLTPSHTQHHQSQEQSQPQSPPPPPLQQPQQQQHHNYHHHHLKHRHSGSASSQSSSNPGHRAVQSHKPAHHRAHFAAAYRPQAARNSSQRNLMRLQALKAAGAGAAAGAGVGGSTTTNPDVNSGEGGITAAVADAISGVEAATSGHIRQVSDPTIGQTRRHHVRKKSAPVGRIGGVIQQDKAFANQTSLGLASGSTTAAGGGSGGLGTGTQQGQKQSDKAAHPSHHVATVHHVAHPARPGMRRNFSTPVIRHQRNTSNISAKKSALGTAQPMTRTKSHDRPTYSSSTASGRQPTGDGNGNERGGAARGRTSTTSHATASATAAPRDKKTVPKKTVGFQLSADSTDESEWEDNNSPSGTTSPASTRQNSVVTTGHDHGQGKYSSALDQNQQNLQEFQRLLSHHTTYTPGARSPLAQIHTPTQPQPFAQDEQLRRPRQSQLQLQHQPRQQGTQGTPTTPTSDHPRFMYNRKAPPSISSVSISAHAPLASAQPHPAMSAAATSSQSSNTTPTTTASSGYGGASSSASGQGASFSVEGGVSRFLTSGPTGASSIATDTSVSPYMHNYRTTTITARPTTPGAGAGAPSDDKSLLTSPTSRYRVTDLASRTQQRLWLDRDSMTPGLRPATAASAIGLDGDFRYRGEFGNALMGGIDSTMVAGDDRDGTSTTTGGLAMNPGKRNRKLYDKYTTEFSVVHRFRDPVADSFRRLQMLPKSDRDVAAAKDTAGIPKDYIGAHLSPSTAHLSLQSQAAAAAGRPGTPTSASTSQAQTPTHSRRRSGASSKFGSQVRFKTMSPEGDDNSTDYSSDDHGDSLVMQKKQHNTSREGGPPLRGGLAGPHRRLPLRGPQGMTGVIQEEAGNTGGTGFGGEQVEGHPVGRRPTDEEMLLRRIWNWRDMAVVGGDE